MKRTISLRPEAQGDIRGAALWYERRQRGVGIRLRDEVRTVLNRIEDAPLLFPEVEQGIRRALLRSFPYSVYFVNEPEMVVVIAVLHQHRHPNTYRQRV